MSTPFGTDWDDLTLDHLIAFFSEPRNEGLRWEAKGRRIRPQHIREGVSGFANSHIGGFLVLGVTQDQETKAWSIDHWQPPDEVALWVQNCIGDGGVDANRNWSEISNATGDLPTPAGPAVTSTSIMP